jgi:hypothetical protein
MPPEIDKIAGVSDTDVLPTETATLLADYQQLKAKYDARRARR